MATETLDNALDSLSIKRVDVIKMDVQGAEELVLRGAEMIVNSQHPIIIFEVYPEGPPTMGLSPFGAREWLESRGYEFFAVDRSESLQPVTSQSLSPNVVAIYRK